MKEQWSSYNLWRTRAVWAWMCDVPYMMCCRNEGRPVSFTHCNWFDSWIFPQAGDQTNGLHSHSQNPCFQCVGSQEFAVVAFCAAWWNTEVERASGQLLAILQAGKCAIAAPIKARIEGVSFSVLPLGFVGREHVQVFKGPQGSPWKSEWDGKQLLRTWSTL